MNFLFFGLKKIIYKILVRNDLNEAGIRDQHGQIIALAKLINGYFSHLKRLLGEINKSYYL